MVIKIIVVCFIIAIVLACLFAILSMTKTEDKEVKFCESFTPEEIDKYIAKLNSLIIKAEEDYNKGIESAQSSLQLYKDQLEKVKRLKTKLN